MTKVVINSCFGSFRLSKEAIEMLKARLPLEVEVDEWGWDGMTRHHPLLVEVVEQLGMRAGDSSYCLLVALPLEEERYFIKNNHGLEFIVTPSSLKPPKWVVV